jgi:hypothetical protein
LSKRDGTYNFAQVREIQQGKYSRVRLLRLDYFVDMSMLEPVEAPFGFEKPPPS